MVCSWAEGSISAISGLLQVYWLLWTFSPFLLLSRLSKTLLNTLLHLQAGSPVLLSQASALVLLWMAVKNCAPGPVLGTVFTTSFLITAPGAGATVLTSSEWSLETLRHEQQQE